MQRLCTWIVAGVAALGLGSQIMAEDVKLEVGAAAPEFTSKDDTGKDWKSTDHVGKKIVVVYFYPADLTAGCTKQACGFRDDMAKLQQDGVEVVGVSGDSVANHKIFKDEKKLNFTLLADEDHAVAERYGVWAEKSMYGKTYWGALRATFIIDAAGVVQHVIPKVKPKTHDDEVLAALGQLSAPV